MPKALPQPDGSTPTKPTMAQNLGAIILGLVAVKLATYILSLIHI